MRFRCFRDRELPAPVKEGWRASGPTSLLTVVTAAFVLLSGCAPAATLSAPTPADIPALEAELSARTNDADLMVRLGAAYRAEGDTERASGMFARALQIEPANPSATLYLGLAQEDAGNFTEARELYQRYLEVGNSSALQDEIEERLAFVHREELKASARAALERERDLANTPPQPRTVAVFPFTYVGTSSEMRPLGRALAEMLSTDLAQTDRLQVLERLRVQMLLDEMSLGESGLADPATAARSGRMLGAERVVQGSVGGDAQTLDLSAAVVALGTASDGTPAILNHSDAVDAIFELEKQLALQIYAEAGVELTPAEWERVSQRPTENVQALLAFGLGLEAADAGNFAEAVQHFNQAVAIDPSFTLAREQADQTAEIAAASQTPTSQIAIQIAMDTPVLEIDFADIEALIPSVITRDATAEALGHEGIGEGPIATTPTILQIIISRP